MGWRTRLAAAVAALTLTATAAPSARAAPFDLDASAAASGAVVAVDASGGGHFAWNQSRDPARGDVLHYCRIPRGRHRCTRAHTFVPPVGGEAQGVDFTGPEVFLPDDETVVLLTRRCCPGRAVTYVSHDGGQTFGAANRVGDNAPSGDAALGPGSFAVSTLTSGETGGIYFQASPYERGPAPSERANVGDEGRGDDNPRDGGTIGFVDALTPLVAFPDGHYLVVRRFGGGTMFNSLAAWEPPTTVLNGFEPRLAGGPRGLFLLYRTLDPGSHYVVRRWSGARFAGPGVALSSRHGAADVSEDARGGIHVVMAVGDVLRRAISTNGGRSFRVVTLARREQFGRPRIAGAGYGGGWVVWTLPGGGVRAAAYARPSGR